MCGYRISSLSLQHYDLLLLCKNYSTYCGGYSMFSTKYSNGGPSHLRFFFFFFFFFFFEPLSSFVAHTVNAFVIIFLETLPLGRFLSSSFCLYSINHLKKKKKKEKNDQWIQISENIATQFVCCPTFSERDMFPVI